MSKIFRLPRLTSIFLVLVLTACMVSLASGLSIPGDRDGDRTVSDNGLARAYQDQKNGKISAADLKQIELIHEKYPLSVTDSVGNTIMIYKPLTRVVVLNGLVIEMMQTLNATDVIVGVTVDLENEPLISPALKSLPTVGKVVMPDLEAILQLNPDAVINYASTSWGADEIQKKLQNAEPDLIVIRLDMHHPETHINEVEILAKIFDKEAEAKEYIDFYNGVLIKIQKATGNLSEEDLPRVYFEEMKDFQTGSNESYFSEDLGAAGARNVFAGLLTPYPTVDQESIIAANPDIVIRTFYNRSSGGYTNDDTSMMEALRESIVQRPGSENITAVQNNKVYVLCGYLIGGARHIVGISYLAKMIHPDLLADLDPVEVHQRYLDFAGFKYDSDKHRAFVVPEL